MSRGPGHIQRSVTALFDAEPQRRASTEELAAHVYGPNPRRSQINNLTRCLRTHADDMGLAKCRVGKPGKRGGWHHVFGKAR